MCLARTEICFFGTLSNKQKKHTLKPGTAASGEDGEPSEGATGEGSDEGGGGGGRRGSRRISAGDPPIARKFARSASTVAVLAAVEASKAKDRSDSLSEAANGKCVCERA